MIIGLTGGIGCGKSYISRGLAKHGFTIYDCDREAKRLIEQDPEVKAQITALFGSEAYKDGKYQTKFVAEKVFKDPTLLQALNAIVHPAVKKDILRLADSPVHRLTDSPIIVESAILYESGLDKICNQVIAVTAPEEIRIERAMCRDHANAEQIKARIKAQMSDSERAQRADIVIHNDGTKKLEDTCQYIMQHL